MALTGDLFLQRPDADAVFEPNRHLTDSADIFFCNLETVVSDSVPTPLYLHAPRTDEAVFRSYVRAGVNVVNLANNASTAYGVDTLVDMLDAVDRAGVARVGAGRNAAEARQHAIVERNGVRVAFLGRSSVGVPEGAAQPERAGVAYMRVDTSYQSHWRIAQAPGTPPIVRTTVHQDDCDALAADLAAARDVADVVVLYWHWGLSISSGTGDLTEYQRTMGRFAIDHGADLVFGGHCHDVQPIEVYRGKTIAFALGNYAHDLLTPRIGPMSSILLQCQVRDREIAEVSFVPGWSNTGTHEKLPAYFRPPSEVPELVERIRLISAEFGTEFEIGTDAVRVVTTASSPEI